LHLVCADVRLILHCLASSDCQFTVSVSAAAPRSKFFLFRPWGLWGVCEVLPLCWLAGAAGLAWHASSVFILRQNLLDSCLPVISSPVIHLISVVGTAPSYFRIFLQRAVFLGRSADHESSSCRSRSVGHEFHSGYVRAAQSPLFWFSWLLSSSNSAFVRFSCATASVFVLRYPARVQGFVLLPWLLFLAEYEAGLFGTAPGFALLLMNRDLLVVVTVKLSVPLPACVQRSGSRVHLCVQFLRAQAPFQAFMCDFLLLFHCRGSLWYSS
jgi:hypothetical protein